MLYTIAWAKDLLQELAWLATAITVIVTIVKSISESKLSREQRARDLRWKQAEAAKSLNSQMLNDPLSKDARLMLDFPDGTVEIPPTKTRVPITEKDICLALSTEPGSTDELHAYIQRCFDNLFYYLATLEHYIDTTLVVSDDVKFPVDYYVRLLDEYQPEVDNYLAKNHLYRAQAFLKRCRSWSKPAPHHGLGSATAIPDGLAHQPSTLRGS
jgi:hypothetical protein